MKKEKIKGHFSMFKKGIFGVAMASMMAVTPFFVGCSGVPGKDGALWYTGLDVSEYDDKGKVGDFFYDTDDGVVYQKTDFGWSEVSVIKGKDGTAPTIAINQDGYWVINGNVTSHQSTGQDGDTPYIKDGTWWIGDKDTTIAVVGENGKSAFDLYKEQNPNFDGTLADWLASLKGEKGEQGETGKAGANWLSGIGNPTDSIGVDGDLYLNTLTYDLFIKKSGSWGSPICNIKGQTGENGYDRVLATRTGSADSSLVISESGVDLYNLNLADETQLTTIYGPNRFNFNKAKFDLSGHKDYHSIDKDEENGVLKLTSQNIENSEIDDLKNTRVHASYIYEAEFDGSLWLGCDVEVSGAEYDLGIRMQVYDENDPKVVKTDTKVVNNVSDGKLKTSIDVNKGDKVRVIFYIRNQPVNSDVISVEENEIKYKNIMLQYDELTEYVPFEDFSNYGNLEAMNLADLEWTRGRTSDADVYGFTATLSAELVDRMVDVVLPDQNTLSTAILHCDDKSVNLLSYQDVYKMNKGVGLRMKDGKATIIVYIGQKEDGVNYETSEFKDWLAANNVTITYEIKEYSYVGFSDIKIMKGSRIVSSGDFTLEYTFLAEKKS